MRMMLLLFVHSNVLLRKTLAIFLLLRLHRNEMTSPSHAWLDTWDNLEVISVLTLGFGQAEDRLLCWMREMAARYMCTHVIAASCILACACLHE